MNNNADRAERSPLRGSLAIFALVLILELAAVWVCYSRGYYMSDALSKTANAYYVLLADPPNLASIGFVWNPLPSLLQIPILLLAPLWRPLQTHGVAGGIVTAAFAAFNAAFLFYGLRRAKLGRGGSLMLALLFALNPYLLFYGANGMSEMLFYTFQMLALFFLARWCEERTTLHLFLLALALAGSFLCRYEAFALAIAIGIALIIMIFFVKDPLSPFQKTFSMKLHYFIATALVVFMPLLVAAGVWVLLCWAIMGDPLHFVRSMYSNTAQTLYISDPTVTAALSSISGILGMMWEKSTPFLLLYMAIVVVRLFTKRLFKSDFWVLTALVFTMLAFHFVMMLTGKSFGWLRFYAYSLPTAMAWLPHEIKGLKRGARRWAALGFAIVLIISGVLVADGFSSPTLSPEENEAFQRSSESGLAHQVAVARRINEEYADNVILMDCFMTSLLILNLENTNYLIMNTSPQFLKAVEEPQKYGIQYMVLANPGSVGALDAINDAYPGLYYEGAPWCQEVEDFVSYKLVKVLYDIRD